MVGICDTVYESLEPCDEESIAGTKSLCQKYLDNEYVFKSKDIEDLTRPYNPAEKMQRSRGTRSKHTAALSPAARKARSRSRNPDAYAKEKEMKKQSRQENPDEYAKEKKTKVDQRRRKKEEQLMNQINTDTGFESICAVCCEFKSSSVTVDLDTLTRSEIDKYAWRIDRNKEIDGSFSVCDTCRKAIRKGETPKKVQNPQLTDFPNAFMDQVVKILGRENPKLNKLEGFLLKTVIPFIRVAHCIRGPHFQVKGSLILISSDIKHSLQKILPLAQEIIPVKFKRKLCYDGFYIGEYVDRKKVQLFYEWFKTNNHLYAEIDLDEDLLEKFEEAIDIESDDILRLCSKEIVKSNDEVNDDLEDEDELLLDDDDNAKVTISDCIDDSEPIKQQHTTCMMNKYEEDLDAPTVANRLAKLIVYLEKEKVLINEVTDEIELDHINDDQISEFYPVSEDDDEVLSESEVETKSDVVTSDKISNDNVNSDQMSNAQVQKSAQSLRNLTSDNLSAVCVAPGEMGEFQNWKEDVYLEEKCFPELFPRGVGGYLSTCISTKRNVGFANYCRNRLKSSDAKYRNNQIYIFFLQLVKELIALESAVSTNLRQARNTKGLTKECVTNVRMYDLERFNRSYSVFKKNRGTSAYFEAAKKDLFATIRQKGAPTLFVTLSAGEYQS